MSIRTAGFGEAEPYDRALRAGGGRLRLHGSSHRRRTFDLDRFARPADVVDLALLAELEGPVLDLGCGPGRMVAAARRMGLAALGVDASAAAVELASCRGLPVLHRSVFDPLPLPASWNTVLLLDGNIGIGGDPDALLRRCAELLAPSGVLVVEVEPDLMAQHVFTARLVDDSGARSAEFRWAEAGAHAVIDMGSRQGLGTSRAWSMAGRSFVALSH